MRILVPLRGAAVALLWSGLSLSALGDQLYVVALTWIAVSVMGSSAGYLSALQALVALAAVLGIGRWADRWEPRRSMVAADLMRAAVLIIVVTSWLIGGGPSVAGLLAAVVVLAIGQGVFQPALQTVLPSLVGDARLLPAANGLLDATDRSARLLGPGLVALLAGTVPVVHFLTLDAFSFVASAMALLLITRLRGRGRVIPRPEREGIWRGMMRGIRAIGSHPILRYALLTSGLINGAWYAVYYLALPLLIEQHLVAGSLGAFGLVISAYGCTNLAATMVVGGRPLSLQPQFQMFAGNLVSGVGTVLLGLASGLPSHWLLPGLMAAASLGAIGGPMKDVPLAVLRQTRLHHADIAAAMRAYMAATSAGILMVMLLVPTAIRLVGIVPVIVTGGAVMIGTGLIGFGRYGKWSETGLIETVNI